MTRDASSPVIRRSVGVCVGTMPCYSLLAPGSDHLSRRCCCLPLVGTAHRSRPTADRRPVLISSSASTDIASVRLAVDNYLRESGGVRLESAAPVVETRLKYESVV